MGTTSAPRRWRAVLAVAAGVLLTLAAAGAALADDMGVQIYDDGFSQAETTLHPVGAAVHWTNMGTQSHSVKFADGVESPVLAPGQTYQRTFTALGDYPYTCGVHPQITGIVHVVTMDAASSDDASGGGEVAPPTDVAGAAPGGGSGLAIALIVLGSLVVGSWLVRRRLGAA